MMSRLALLSVADGLLGAPDAEYLRLARTFRAELAPRDLLEGLQVDLTLLALALLRRALNALALAPDDPKVLRRHAQAHKMLTQSLREFARLRKRSLDTPAPVAANASAPSPARPAPEPAPPPKAETPRPRPRPNAPALLLDDLFPPVGPITAPRPDLNLTVGRRLNDSA